MNMITDDDGDRDLPTSICTMIAVGVLGPALGHPVGQIAGHLLKTMRH